MASNYLGPETPRPYAIISELFRNKLMLSETPQFPELDEWSLGPTYEEALVKVLHKHLETLVTDAVCYVGKQKGSLVRLLHQRLGLLQEVEELLPVAVHQEETSEQRRVTVPIEHTCAEAHFSELSKRLPHEARRYDRLLLYHSADTFRRQARSFRHMLATLRPGGKLVIVHRAWELSTLPVYSRAHEKLGELRPSYTTLLSALQEAGYDVSWEIETLPIIIPKREWLRLLREQFPAEMEVLSEQETGQGLRELTEGALKYQGEMIQFSDRLLVVSASSPEPKQAPSLRRRGQQAWTPLTALSRMRCSMEITKEVKEVLDQQQDELQRKQKARQIKRVR